MRPSEVASARRPVSQPQNRENALKFPNRGVWLPGDKRHILTRHLVAAGLGQESPPEVDALRDALHVDIDLNIGPGHVEGVGTPTPVGRTVAEAYPGLVDLVRQATESDIVVAERPWTQPPSVPGRLDALCHQSRHLAATSGDHLGDRRRRVDVPGPFDEVRHVDAGGQQAGSAVVEARQAGEVGDAARVMLAALGQFHDEAEVGGLLPVPGAPVAPWALRAGVDPDGLGQQRHGRISHMGTGPLGGRRGGARTRRRRAPWS